MEEVKRELGELRKMLVAVVNGQSSLKQDLLKGIMKNRVAINNLKTDTKKNFGKVNKRLDIIGSQVAYLEDDTPTRKEFDKLEKRVEKVEGKVASA